jgi:hypothetical protein
MAKAAVPTATGAPVSSAAGRSCLRACSWPTIR